VSPVHREDMTIFIKLFGAYAGCEGAGLRVLIMPSDLWICMDGSV
jgi:hypothetical protein